MMLTADKLKKVQNALDRIEDAFNAVEAIEDEEKEEGQFHTDGPSTRGSTLHTIAQRLREHKTEVEKLYS